ncbi:MAG: N-6 DNA methylase [Paludibacteraceae bacterium]|nr:N-6 DNA methylase [Paludibacteraceae bacterium]
MITKDNLKRILGALGFSKENEVYSKHYESTDCDLKVDFKEGKIIYPETKGFVVNERQTCNLSDPENFVVLECVNQLFEKGYHPNHIELEPRWKLGHNAKSGRADIWVRTFKKIDDKETEEKESLLIIECKTSGGEFNGAWKDTLEDGAQLFSYFQQERASKFLCLYTSDFIDDKIKSEYHLINVQDNDDLLINLKEPKTYKKSQNNKELFATWKETYQQDSSTRGLFEPDIAAYEIGKNKYTIEDLVEIDSESMQKKYNEFATILRQHNVSGHENAFDKLVNLFLAKVVDETNNPQSLNFYWKGAAYDDYFHLQDRLQKLYKIGMEKFLGEDVTYIDNKEVEDAFRLFKNDPDATKKTILEYFRQLKFFTNNDFAFIDVHNEHLFYQNSAVLLKIVKMLQDIKLKTKTQNQFLGDLFEGFLDQGVKQSEGQFFTPTPIVKFLISSLPLQQIVDETEIPQVIDYACGAGHFLNEYAEQIKPFVMAKKGNLSDYYGAIVGIEKEYRLSKVSKVASFMYGQDDIKIIYADALSDINDVKSNTFSVLVANPPYSVKGFLETLTKEERSKFELINEVSDIAVNNSIETFFVERAAQLLKIGGVAAIILPSSVLSNGNIYIKCREIILQYFDIVAIAEFGSGTFGKTGTNTVTLFLRRKAVNPSLAEHYRNRVDTWFNGDETKNEVFEDHPLLEAYCQHIGVPVKTYKTLFNTNLITTETTNTGEPQYDNETMYIAAEPIADYHTKSLMDYDIFKEYERVFDAKSEGGRIDTKGLNEKAKVIRKKMRDKAKSKTFKNLSLSEQDALISKELTSFIKEIEKDKLYYYMLVKDNKQPIVVVKSPANKDDIKKYLGYEWSDAKGNEGIKYLNVTVSKTNEGEGAEDDTMQQLQGIKGIQTPLFNPQDLLDSEKINSIIRQNFQNGAPNIPEQLMSFVSMCELVDMLDFTRVSFDKQIKTTVDKKVEIVSKYPLVKLGDIAEVLKGKSITSAQTKKGNVKVVAGGIDYAYLHNEANRPANTVTISASGANAGYVNFWREPIFASDCTTIRGKNDLHTLFLYNFLLSIQDQIYYLQKGSGQPHVYPDDLKLIQVPNIDEKLQRQIISECEKIDEEYNNSRKSIEECQKKIADVFDKIDKKATKEIRLSNVALFDISIGRRVLNSEVNPNYDIPVYSANVFEPFGMIDKLLIEDFSKDSILWGIDGDWMVNVIPANQSFYPTDHCGVLRIKTDDILPKYMAHLLETEGKKVGFKRSYRASIDRIEGLSVKIAPIDDQCRAISEIETYEQKIAEAKAIMAGCAERKKQILDKWLK